MRSQSVRRAVGGVIALVSLAAASAAAADTVHFEAEAARIQFPFRGTITSPLMIQDDPAASGGSYVIVAAGLNSPAAAPASTTEGVAKYVFSVADTGSYRIWARVSTPTSADDSFWIRVGTGAAWIKWNAMVLGAAFHWVQVKAEGAASPSVFNLTAGADNELQVAYREDGTKLDAFYVSNDSAFDPTAALTGPPLQPIMQPYANGGGATKISWSAVPGATSYTLERSDGDCTFDDDLQCCIKTPFTVVATGLTSHTSVDTTGGLYRVTAIAPTGASTHPAQGPAEACYPFDPSEERAEAGAFHWRAQVPVGSVTAPMKFLSESGVGVPAGTNSTAVVPAHGRLRMDFELAAAANMRMWAEIGPVVSKRNPAQDSFWVRWDDGPWINWNNLDSCATFYDSGKAGSPVVRTMLAAGSHRIEWAYREGGVLLRDNIILREEEPGTPLGEQCSD
jgi:hypothetical protein